LASEAEYIACTLPKTPVGKWVSGRDSVFISNAGTYYFICGTPAHCAQGMKFTIVATGAFVAAPPPPPPVAGAPGPANHTAPTTTFSSAVSLLAALSLSATIAVAM
ncbi:uncharacterized protein, partial [Physcomitrium patens]|uniref:uncharacterized protein n=1 Tax=Physcomitrium patens TaxID=3218 RepID=UPI003CCD4B30